MSNGVLHPRTEAEVRLHITNGLLYRTDRDDHLYLGDDILDSSAKTPIFSFVREEEQPQWSGAESTFRFIVHDSKRAVLRLTALHSPPRNLLEEAMHSQREAVGFVNVSVHALAMGSHTHVDASNVSLLLNTWDVPPGADANAQQRQMLNLAASFEWNSKGPAAASFSRKIRNALLKVSSFMYRYIILRESCSQFDSLPLTSS